MEFLTQLPGNNTLPGGTVILPGWMTTICSRPMATNRKSIVIISKDIDNRHLIFEIWISRLMSVLFMAIGMNYLIKVWFA